MGYYRYGLSFDEAFETAYLEAELNSTASYDYENNEVKLENLNKYLKADSRPSVASVPETLYRFQTLGWICAEDDRVLRLEDEGFSYGRRTFENFDRSLAETFIKTDAGYLTRETHEDGSFTYTLFPRFDTELDWYNIARHAGAIWSMILAYRIQPSEEAKASIDRAVSYLLDKLVYQDENTAHIYWENRDDIELGADSLAVIALAEYTDVFGTDDFLAEMTALGHGIMRLQNSETGGFVHVLDSEYAVSKESEISFYDGEAAFALCRLYELTSDVQFLESAQSSVDYMIAEDYTRYRDQWVSYAMNEITKLVDNRPDYYSFGLKNAVESMNYIRERRTPAPTRMEQLIITFELYLRMVDLGLPTDDFDLELLLNTVNLRADRQLDGRYYPEFAMYMANPCRILDVFMMRYESFRIRVDEVQHNICGYYLYWKNYDRLMEYGLFDQ